VQAEIRRLQAMSDDEVYRFARDISAPLHLVQEVKRLGRLPVVNFAAGGVATPADAALMMQLGMDGVFVGSGIFKSEDPAKRARAIVQAVAHYNDPKVLMEVSRGLGQAMVGVQDLHRDPVNFRGREAGEVSADGKPTRSTDAHMHGSSWSTSG
jgi:pyridoxal 5'-phosphate synthase pdxS subunit